MEHKESTHGLLLYQSTLSTVLIVKRKDFKSGTNDKFRTLADVAPTIYKIVGVEIKNLDGKPLDEDGERIVPLLLCFLSMNTDGKTLEKRFLQTEELTWGQSKSKAHRMSITKIFFQYHPDRWRRIFHFCLISGISSKINCAS